MPTAISTELKERRRIRFTIVTPTLNRRDLLEEAIRSVAGQAHPNLEHIVVDGGSTDGTLEMLAAMPTVTVLQDRRQGLYAAINMGIRQATGEVIGILNSDDLYPPGTLDAVEEMFASHPQADAVCGSAEIFDGQGHIQHCANPADLRLDAHAALIGSCITNARFFRREVFDRVGLFALDFPRVADREFLARSLVHRIRTECISTTVYRYRRHDGSLTFATDALGSESIRAELLLLARTIGLRPDLGANLRWKARALEGRCLLALSWSQIRVGDMAGFWRTVATQDDGLSLRPTLAMACGAADRLIARRPR